MQAHAKPAKAAGTLQDLHRHDAVARRSFPRRRSPVRRSAVPLVREAELDEDWSVTANENALLLLLAV